MPEGFFKHFLNFLYLTDIVMGIATITFCFVLLRQSRASFRELFLLFNLSFVIYLIWNYIDFYRTKIIMIPELSKILFLIGDISFVCLLYFWTIFSASFCESGLKHRKPLLLACVAFILTWQAFYLIFFDAAYQNTALTGAWAAIIADTAFIGYIMAINYALVRKNTDNNCIPCQLYCRRINTLLFIYLGWYFLWDVGLNFFPAILEQWMVYPLDLINVLFPFFCWFTVSFALQTMQTIIPGAATPEAYSDINHLPNIANSYQLTEREIEIFTLVYQGKSNPEIADQLCISSNTVKRHMNNIYRKTACKNRVQLIQLRNKE